MTTDATLARRSARREKHATHAAGLINGPNELLDFLLPMWAGMALEVGATQVGTLMALEMAVSVLARPLAGVLADRHERRHLAALGAILYGLSCAGFALADSMTLAYAAAALGGLGGAVFWVSLRALISERLTVDSGVFARLLSAQETGSWIAFVAAMTTISYLGFFWIFLACAAACLLGAGYLLSAPDRVDAPTPPKVDQAGLRRIGRKLRPMLLAVMVTMMAEAAIGLLLLLHLQRDLGLGIVEVAFVFLPGGIAISVLPPYLHRVVVRFGRTRVLAVASLSSALFAASLAWAANPLAVGALWVLSGAAWAAVMPIQQAVIAEASGTQAGRGMGLYESACLVGGMVGSLGAGLLYDGSSWVAACLVSAGIIAAGAVIVPRAVRRLGVEEFPAAVPRSPAHRARPQDPATVAPRAPSPPRRSGTAPVDSRTQLVNLAWHGGLFGLGQLVAAALGLSWLYDTISGRLPFETILSGPPPGLHVVESFVYKAGTVWVAILLLDVAVTAWRVWGRPARPADEE